MILFAKLQKTRNYSKINEDMIVHMIHWQIPKGIFEESH